MRTRGRAHGRRVVATVALVILALSSCGTGSDPGEDRYGAVEHETGGAELRPGDVVPAPVGEAVLAVTGRIGVTNVGDELLLDLRTLEQLASVTGKVFEPWTKQDLGFRGVRLADLLDIAGVDPDATTIELTALDDYIVELSLDKIDDSVIVATRRRDGGAIPVDEGGPTRLVFLDDGAEVADPDNWIWSLATLTVR